MVMTIYTCLSFLAPPPLGHNGGARFLKLHVTQLFFQPPKLNFSTPKLTTVSVTHSYLLLKYLCIARVKQHKEPASFYISRDVCAGHVAGAARGTGENQRARARAERRWVELLSIRTVVATSERRRGAIPPEGGFWLTVWVAYRLYFQNSSPKFIILFFCGLLPWIWAMYMILWDRCSKWQWTKK